MQNTIDRAVAITKSLLVAYNNDEWDVMTELYLERQPLLVLLCTDQAKKTISTEELRAALDFIYQADQNIMGSCQQSLNHCADQLSQLSTSKKMINAYQQYDHRS